MRLVRMLVVASGGGGILCVSLAYVRNTPIPPLFRARLATGNVGGQNNNNHI